MYCTLLPVAISGSSCCGRQSHEAVSISGLHWFLQGYAVYFIYSCNNIMLLSWTDCHGQTFTPRCHRFNRHCSLYRSALCFTFRPQLLLLLMWETVAMLWQLVALLWQTVALLWQTVAQRHHKIDSVVLADCYTTLHKLNQTQIHATCKAATVAFLYKLSGI